MNVGVVTVTHRRTHHLQNQQRALRECAGVGHRVVVAIDDPLHDWAHDDREGAVVVDLVTDGRHLPLAAARNAGVDVARQRGCDLVVLLDVDCVPAPDLVQAYVDAAVDRPRHLLCGPVTYLPRPGDGGYPWHDLPSLDDPHPARPAPPPGEVLVDPDGHDLFWSLSFAVTVEAWQTIGGFDEAYVGYGGEDTDFGRRARAAGIPLAWVGGARAYHQWHPVSDPPVEHLHDIVRNAALFHERWGEWPMAGWLDAFEARDLVARDSSGAYRVI